MSAVVLWLGASALLLAVDHLWLRGRGLQYGMAGVLAALLALRGFDLLAELLRSSP